MNLPHLPPSPDDETMLIVFRSLAETFEAEGRRALSGCCFGIGNALRNAAAKLSRCAEIIEVVAVTQDRSFFTFGEIRVMDEADESLRRVAHFLGWDDQVIGPYRQEIARRRSRLIPQYPEALPLQPTREPDRLPLYERTGKKAKKRTRRQQAKPGALRRYVVKEIVSAMAWSGTVWASACSTRESALRCFDRRLMRNLHHGNENALVVVFDRKTRKVVASSRDITHREARLWCH